MARRLRLQFPGARYHIINRGNFRQAVFASEGAWQAFVSTLDQAAERFRWRIHAYVVMSNHYHLALETPEPNLALGMHWLQSTYATRHNRFRRRQGHLFQGRFKSLLVEDAAHLSRVVDYIHLNPARARIVSAERLLEYRPSSLGRFCTGNHPRWLVTEEIMESAGLTGSPDPWSSYVSRLMLVAANPSDDERMSRGALSAGWAIGTNGWRQALARDQARTQVAPEWSVDELNAYRLDLWKSELAAGLAEAGRTITEAAKGPKITTWKIDLARRLRSAAAPYRWIAAMLEMGAASSVRAEISRSAQRPAG